MSAPPFRTKLSRPLKTWLGCRSARLMSISRMLPDDAVVSAIEDLVGMQVREVNVIIYDVACRIFPDDAVNSSIEELVGMQVREVNVIIYDVALQDVA